MQLNLKNLVHRFSGRRPDSPPALSVDQLEAQPGQFMVITGPSGSGKTTLLYVLSGLLRPQSGQISWDTNDIAKLSESARDMWRRTHAGFVFQNFHLIPEMTALQNVTVAAYFNGWSARHLHSRAEDLLQGFDVPLGNRTVDTYSRGEQQRVALARALIFDPSIVFADEPTASLDENSATEIGQLFRRLTRDEGKTVIAVSHDNALMSQADVILHLDHGHLLNGTGKADAA